MGQEHPEKVGVVRWEDRDRILEGKLRSLYSQYLDRWISMQGDRKFEQKWHVGREMLDWFYQQHLLNADEFEALNVCHSRPSKPGYDIEMYRIIWISSGRASDQVAGISLAPRMGPSKGYNRRASGEEKTASGRNEATVRREVALAALVLKAEKELTYGEGGWLYCYGYEEALRHSVLLGEVPLLKVGHTGGSYAERVRTQVRGTEIPDSPRILRAYRVVDSVRVESEVHRRLKGEGRHHRRAGGSEWFRVGVARLDAVVEEVIQYLARAGQQ